jgi:hypothetical protein
MKHRFSTAIIAAPVVVIVAIAIGSLGARTGKPSDPDASEVSSARAETAPMILAQYNSCPNRNCR